MVDLAKLKDDIGALGEKIRNLKQASPVDKDAITAAVQELLTAKKLYADNNDVSLLRSWLQSHSEPQRNTAFGFDFCVY